MKIKTIGARDSQFIDNFSLLAILKLVKQFFTHINQAQLL